MDIQDLLKALNTVKGRDLLIRFEDELRRLVFQWKTIENAALVLPRMTSYHRLLLHATAERFKLRSISEPMWDSENYKSVRCYLTPEACIPPLSYGDLLAATASHVERLIRPLPVRQGNWRTGKDTVFQGSGRGAGLAHVQVAKGKGSTSGHSTKSTALRWGRNDPAAACSSGAMEGAAVVGRTRRGRGQFRYARGGMDEGLQKADVSNAPRIGRKSTVFMGSDKVAGDLVPWEEKGEREGSQSGDGWGLEHEGEELEQKAEIDGAKHVHGTSHGDGETEQREWEGSGGSVMAVARVKRGRGTFVFGGPKAEESGVAMERDQERLPNGMLRVTGASLMAMDGSGEQSGAGEGREEVATGEQVRLFHDYSDWDVDSGEWEQDDSKPCSIPATTLHILELTGGSASQAFVRQHVEQLCLQVSLPYPRIVPVKDQSHLAVFDSVSAAEEFVSVFAGELSGGGTGEKKVPSHLLGLAVHRFEEGTDVMLEACGWPRPPLRRRCTDTGPAERMIAGALRGRVAT